MSSAALGVSMGVMIKAIAVCAVIFCGTGAWASQIAVANPSFEEITPGAVFYPDLCGPNCGYYDSNVPAWWSAPLAVDTTGDLD